MKFSKKWVRLSIAFTIVGGIGGILVYLWHVLFGHTSTMSFNLWSILFVISICLIIIGIGLIPLAKLRCPYCGRSTPRLRWDYTAGFCPKCGNSLECDFTECVSENQK